MAEETNPADPYAPWRKSLRETLKWYVAALSAFGTLLLGGLSFGILPDLQGRDQYFVMALGFIAILLVLKALWEVQKVLQVRSFARERLREDAVRERIEPYLDTLLVGAGTVVPLTEGQELKTLDDLLEARRIARFATPPDLARLAEIEAIIGPTAGFGAYQELQAEIDVLNRNLAGIFVLVAGLAMAITAFWGTHKADPPDTEISFLYATRS